MRMEPTSKEGDGGVGRYGGKYPADDRLHEHGMSARFEELRDLENRCRDDHRGSKQERIARGILVRKMEQ